MAIVNMTPQADTGLVSAFDKLGKSFQPADLSGMYKTQADTATVITNSILKNQAKEEAETNRRGELLSKISSQSMALVESGDYDGSFSLANEAKLKNLKSRLENTEEGSKEERKILGEARNYYAQVDNIIKSSIDAKTTLAGNDKNPINFVAMNTAFPGAIGVLTAIGNKTATYGMEDEVLYAYDGKGGKMSASDIAEVKNYRKDLNVDKNYRSIIESQQNLGGKGLNFDGDEVESRFTSEVINTKGSYFDAATRKLRGFETSFQNALASNKELHAAIMSVSDNKYKDENADGIIDEIAGTGGKAVIDKILKDWGGGSGMGPTYFKEYAKLQSEEEYKKFRDVFDTNEKKAEVARLKARNDSQWRTKQLNQISSIKRKGVSNTPTQLSGLGNLGTITFDKASKRMIFRQYSGNDYTADDAKRMGDPNLEGEMKMLVSDIGGEQMMDQVFGSGNHRGFKATFPELFKIYGAGPAPIIYK